MTPPYDRTSTDSNLLREVSIANQAIDAGLRQRREIFHLRKANELRVDVNHRIKKRRNEKCFLLFDLLVSETRVGMSG